MLDTVTDLRSLLKDPSLVPNKAYVAGEWIEAADGATFPVTNPARGDVIALVPNLTRADAARAIEVADKVRHEWAARTGKERAAVLRKWFDLCMENLDDLGAILTAEQGKPLAEAKGESPMVRPISSGLAKRPSASTVKPFPAISATSASR